VADERAFRRHFVTESPEETRAVGARLGASAQPGDVFLLEGDFGCGKTVLVQGLAAGLGVATPVTSPSFVLVHQHQGRFPLYHVDLYRAERLDPELEETVADILGGDGVTCIEWPRLLPDDLRHGASIVRFTRADDEARLLVLETDQQRLVDAADGKGPTPPRREAPAL
jgi:tRNA threonylcarbamoyladenosine biosynthesis protein TsaE